MDFGAASSPLGPPGSPRGRRPGSGSRRNTRDGAGQATGPEATRGTFHGEAEGTREGGGENRARHPQEDPGRRRCHLPGGHLGRPRVRCAWAGGKGCTPRGGAGVIPTDRDPLGSSRGFRPPLPAHRSAVRTCRGTPFPRARTGRLIDKILMICWRAVDVQCGGRRWSVRGSQPGVQGNKSNFRSTTCAHGGLGVYFSGSFPFTVS